MLNLALFILLPAISQHKHLLRLVPFPSFLVFGHILLHNDSSHNGGLVAQLPYHEPDLAELLQHVLLPTFGKLVGDELYQIHICNPIIEKRVNKLVNLFVGECAQTTVLGTNCPAHLMG